MIKIWLIALLLLGCENTRIEHNTEDKGDTVTVSDPIDMRLIAFEEDISNAIVGEYVFNAIQAYSKYDKVTQNSVVFRAKKDTRNVFLNNMYGNFQDNSYVMDFIEYSDGIKNFHMYYGDIHYIHMSGDYRFVKFAYGYKFSLMGWPMISDHTEILRRDAYGNFTEPYGTHDYVKFELTSSTNVHITNYEDGYSGWSPGTIVSEEDITVEVFAERYPNVIFVDSSKNLYSTMGGLFNGDSESVKNAIFTQQFNGEIGLDADTRWQKINGYEPELVVDPKNYTGLASKVFCKFTLKGYTKFDTVTLGHIIAEKVNIVFKDASGIELSRVDDYMVDNSRDIHDNIEDYRTTSIFYSTHDEPDGSNHIVPADGTVEIELIGQNIFIGNIQLSLAADVGISGFKFSTEIIDFSPTEKNFEVITYVDGLRVREYSGTFTFWTKHGDIHNRFFESCAGKQITVNGSDTRNNQVPDGAGRFASTMMLCRVKSLILDTIEEDNILGEFMVATFVFREIV